jgi:hypothetical protein
MFLHRLQHALPSVMFAVKAISLHSDIAVELRLARNQRERKDASGCDIAVASSTFEDAGRPTFAQERSRHGSRPAFQRGTIVEGRLVTEVVSLLSTHLLAATKSEFVNRSEYDQQTALHLAAGEGHALIAQVLCEASANVKTVDRWTRQPPSLQPSQSIATLSSPLDASNSQQCSLDNMRIGRQRRHKGRHRCRLGLQRCCLLIQQFSLRIEYTDKRYPHKLARFLLQWRIIARH